MLFFSRFGCFSIIDFTKDLAILLFRENNLSNKDTIISCFSNANLDNLYSSVLSYKCSETQKRREKQFKVFRALILLPPSNRFTKLSYFPVSIFIKYFSS